MEMGIEQTTFYEEIAIHLERNLSQLNEIGFVNALICFKNVQTRKQLSVVHDLEEAVKNNAEDLEFASICSLLHCYVRIEESRQNKKVVFLLKEQAIKEV